MSRDQEIQRVLDGLQSLILMGARSAASREYVPTHDPDADEDVIRDGKAAVAELRSLRQRFEDLMIGGVIEEYETSRLQEWFDTPQKALDNHTPRQMGLKGP